MLPWYYYINALNCIKGQKDMTPKDESPRSEGVLYVLGRERRRITNSPWMNEVARPKWIEFSAADVSGVESKIRCCKEQYCVGIWNVRSMNQRKLDMVKQVTVRINISILRISQIKWISQFSSVTQSCPTLCDPMNRSTPGLPVHHHLLEFT